MDEEYAQIICIKCGLVFLTEEEYDEQMSKPTSKWTCPNCLQEAYFDDDYFEDKHFIST